MLGGGLDWVGLIFDTDSDRFRRYDKFLKIFEVC